MAAKYYLFIQYEKFKNIFVGFGSLILRLIYGVIFGLLTIQRMDVPTVAYHLEQFDAGYGAYVG